MKFSIVDVFAEHPLKERLPLQERDLLVWVNVDDEPKTTYVDQLTGHVGTTHNMAQTGVSSATVHKMGVSQLVNPSKSL